MNERFFLLLGLYVALRPDLVGRVGLPGGGARGTLTRLAALENQVARLTPGAERPARRRATPAAGNGLPSPPCPGAAAAGDTYAQDAQRTCRSRRPRRRCPPFGKSRRRPLFSLRPVGPQAEPQADPDGREPSSAAAARTAEPPPVGRRRDFRRRAAWTWRPGSVGRLFVWLGVRRLGAGLALPWVKYSIDEGPAERLASAGDRPAISWAGSCWRGRPSPRRHDPSGSRPPCSAAGIATFYAASFAASSL